MEILIAEDDNVSRRLLHKIIEKLGYKVISAEDGSQAWDIFQKKPVKMVITDWMMPEMDGLELCRKIRGAKPSHYVYIIILTAKDQAQDSVKGLDAGADDYIIKPFKSGQLRARIRAGRRIIQLEEDFQKAHIQLLHSEKMASIGRLAAGVAHEINNPLSFVGSNLETLLDYRHDVEILLKEYGKLVTDLKNSQPGVHLPDPILKQMERISALETSLDIDFILDDIPGLIQDSRAGTERIKKIVLGLKDFARPEEQGLQPVDINKSINSTLDVVWNKLKDKAAVTKDFGALPLVRSYAQELNQVFMNILLNAADAIKDRGEIKIMTRAGNGYVEVVITDTGAGISEENLSKIFDPFFTTKEIGAGEGLGLNFAYNIIQKCNGTIDVQSAVGQGTVFTIRIPVRPVTDDETQEK